MAFSEEPFGKYFTPNADIQVSVHKFHDGVVENALGKLKAKYGKHGIIYLHLAKPNEAHQACPDQSHLFHPTLFVSKYCGSLYTLQERK